MSAGMLVSSVMDGNLAAMQGLIEAERQKV